MKTNIRILLTVILILILYLFFQVNDDKVSSDFVKEHEIL